MPIPVVLVHGLRGSGADWNTIRALLEGAGHEVVAPDLPGHGGRRNEQFTIDGSLATIEDAARSTAREPALVGHALGGHLAIRSAADNGAAGVVAIGCGTEALGWVLDSYLIASAAYAFLPDKGAALSAAATTTFVGGEPDADSPQFLDTLGQLKGLDTRATLARVDAPVWLLNGQYDQFRMQERAFVRAGRSVTLVRQRGARLAGDLDQPGPTAELLEDILARLL